MPKQPGPAEIAAGRLARLVWRRAGPPRGEPPALERRWMGGLQEAAAVLEELTGTAARKGWGFGGPVPWVPVGGTVIACGVPVAVATAEVQGPDGAYRVSGAGVYREAAGREGELISLEDRRTEGPDPGFDLLWFGGAERYRLLGGRVEIEDLFARVVAPADRQWLDRVLVRGLRVDPGCLDGLVINPSRDAATIEVRRAEELTPPGWNDPRRLMGAREFVERVEGHEPWLRLHMEGGQVVEAAVSEVAGGWVVHFDGDTLPWRRLWCRSEDGSVVYGAEPGADPRDPGVRTRWAFDLISDLLRLDET